ncbi:MAG: glycosyltransferase N-terminal domain-containing protein [Acidobacteriota bacterium]
MFLLYDLLLVLALLVALPYVLVTGVMRGKYLANFPERMGFYRTPAAEHDLWIHAVSVGETVAARPVVDEILRRRPTTSIVFTTTTITGQAQARRLFPDATVTYFPFDFAMSVNRFLAHHAPRAFATMETEIWPNVTRLARARGLRLILANGRISDRSFPRYRAMRPVVARVLRKYERILAREEADRQRFIAIGAPAEAVETTGNVKFDYLPDERPLEIAPQLEQLIAGRKVLVLGSTMAGEDELLLPHIERFAREHNAFVIIAPRKPERFELVAAMLPDAVRRSSLVVGRSSFLLLDSIGELARIYRYATAAFIGGSLLPGVGGHNPIEAAAVGVPVAFGPHMSNFREIAEIFLRQGAASEVRSAEEVIAFAARMFEDWRAMGERARKVVEQNRGAAARTAARIVELLA